MNIDGLLLLLGIPALIVFGHYCYNRGRLAERNESKAAMLERERFMVNAGYDPTPFYRPQSKEVYGHYPQYEVVRNNSDLRLEA